GPRRSGRRVLAAVRHGGGCFGYRRRTDPDRAAPTRESPRPGNRLSRTRISTCEFGAPRGSGDSEQLSVLGQFGIGAGGQIEAAGTAFAGLELRDRHVHPPSACISV